MKTALLAQNEALEAKSLNPDVKKSMLPLSHSVMYPVDVDGAILPCCCVEVVPSDSYRISNEILLRQLQPLKVPQMTRYTLNTAYFYCSNRLGYKKWQQFFDRAHEGRAGVDYTFELPRVANHKDTIDSKDYYSLLDKNGAYGSVGANQDYTNTLHTYFNISMNRILTTNPTSATVFNDSNDCPLAFPFFDYQMICRDFYTNIDRIPDTPDTTYFNDYSNPFSDWSFTNLFPVDEDEIKLVDGIQLNSGFHTGDDSDDSSIKGFVLDKVRYHDLRPDYFTSSKRAPMRGEAPTVDTTVAVGHLDVSGMIDYANNNPTPYAVGLGYPNSGTDPKDKLTAGTLTIDTNPPETVGIQPNATAVATLAGALSHLKISLETTKSINAAELILMTQLSLWKTLNMLAKPTYNDFLRAHFDGVHVGDSLAEAPQYIGGTSQVIDINEVLQTSESSSSSKLGQQAAVAHSLSSSYVGSFFANDQGFIIGVMYIIPDVVYNPAMPRWASRRTVEDFYFPEFANLSMQATLNKELFYSNDKNWNNQALGYVGAYDELRSIPNYCAGLMLDTSGHSELGQWLVRRTFTNDNKPAINQRFLSAKGNVDKSAWSVPDEPKFMFQCANYIEAMRPMPWLAIPKIG